MVLRASSTAIGVQVAARVFSNLDSAGRKILASLLAVSGPPIPFFAASSVIGWVRKSPDTSLLLAAVCSCASTHSPGLASARHLAMAEQEEVLKLISELLLVEADAVPVHVGPQARRGLSRLKTAIEDSDLETVIRSSTNESLPLPAGHLTDPEIRYFNLYRESYTVEHIHAPETNRKLSATRSGGGYVTT